MPNWVFNDLTIQGPKEEIDYIKDKLNEPFSNPSTVYNPETKLMEEKIVSYNNPVFAFWNIVKPTDLETYNKGPQPDGLDMKDEGWWAKHMEWSEKQNDWYNWNIRNWGTKWEVAVSDGEEYPNTELLEHKSEGQDQWLVYKFHTAWSPPLVAISKLSEMVPNSLITLSYEEETGWGGEIEFLRGNQTTLDDYENKCRECGENDSLEYCDNDCGEICSSCHNIDEQVLDIVAECDVHKVYLDTANEMEQE